MTALPSRNDLDRETSPYLLQHRHNPVHWQAWGPEALAAARAANRPILLSVGYAACHWCHVMAHESFEDAGTARLMNELFINIKVDREERPDIDSIYQSALALIGEHGGWPLTMFLTPEGEPFWGGTYFPPEQKFGRPAFRNVLAHVAKLYATDPALIARNRDALRQALSARASEAGDPAGLSGISPALLDQCAARLLGEIDPVHGGIGQAPKFPQTFTLELLWRAYLRTGNPAYRDAVTLTLDRMSQGGIYDHLGGGFARYSTDQRWLVPHFEKMLYDNALLLDLFTLVQPVAQSRLYAARVRETVAWVLRDMLAEGGAFAATQDADSEGEEGKFYVWDEAEIDALLGDAAASFKASYDVSAAGNWEGRCILNRSQRPELLSGADEAALARQRAVLFRARERRVKPGWDDKVLADWNGLMIAALANAGAAFAEPGWIAAAERAFGFVLGYMTERGRLRHAWRHGQLKHAALLDDYANMARAALALHEATGTDDYLAQARAWVAVLDRHYWDTAHGGYFYTADDAEALITRTHNATDNAVPAGNGTMLGVLVRLWHLTGDAAYRQRAEALVQAFLPELGRNFFPLATLLNNSELLLGAVQVVVIGARGEAASDGLLAAARSVSLPNRVLSALPPETPLPDAHPAHGKTQVLGKPTAYVCTGATCSLPVTEPDALRALLSQP
ncbi:MAG TPA: thioredoxin domain-containing protein [Candidatus Sulfotelmatobacter sp.]|nr:thioredoxin domain-containing protein [Candidatus Sulfotelmatobacter sp.]